MKEEYIVSLVREWMNECVSGWNGSSSFEQWIKTRASLKPCPFCGGDAGLVVIDAYNARVECTQCSCKTDGYRDCTNAIKFAKEFWNNRQEEK